MFAAASSNDGRGTHAFQHWCEHQILPTERFHYISELYGYLVKQFTVFGQHVHIGVLEANNQIRDSLFEGNDASWLRGLRLGGAPMPAVVEAASARWMMK